MFNTFLSRRAHLLAAAALVCAPLAAQAAGTGVQGPTLSMIPAVHGQLSILRFQATTTGQDFIRATVARATATAAIASKDGLTKFRTPDRLAAYVSDDGAESEVFANLEHLPTGHGSATAAQSVARSVFGRLDVLPHDDTTFVLGAPTTLFGGNTSGKTGQLLTYVAAKRMVDGLPVLGEGSRATVGVANDGSVQAFVKHWRAAQRAESVTPTLSPGAVQAAIVAQLARYETPSAHVVVDRVGLGYYDGNGSVLQPVYYFTARILPRGGKMMRDGDAVIGYLPVGATVEQVPDLSHPDLSPSLRGGLPGLDHADTVSPMGYASGSTVGDYVVNDSANQQTWDNDGYYLAEDLISAGATWTQYLYAQPYMYLGAANSYINGVNWGVTEAHGDWSLFTTLNNNANFVYLNQIGSGGNPAFGGYGSSNRLAHWLIHSCEVIPSMFDENIATGNGQNAFNVWWNIFGGLHQAIGYRTVMFIGDGAGSAYGQDLARDADVTSGWINTVVSLPSYNLNSTYLSYHLNRQVPYEMPSVITIPSLANETAFSDVPALPARSTGMWNYWVTGPTD